MMNQFKTFLCVAITFAQGATAAPVRWDAAIAHAVHARLDVAAKTGVTADDAITWANSHFRSGEDTRYLDDLRASLNNAKVSFSSAHARGLTFEATTTAGTHAILFARGQKMMLNGRPIQFARLSARGAFDAMAEVLGRSSQHAWFEHLLIPRAEAVPASAIERALVATLLGAGALVAWMSGSAETSKTARRARFDAARDEALLDQGTALCEAERKVKVYKASLSSDVVSGLSEVTKPKDPLSDEGCDDAKHDPRFGCAKTKVYRDCLQAFRTQAEDPHQTTGAIAPSAN